jgi:catechol 2,3-dioxygenase-like lactoylglutathione lyase family enzyme
MAQFRIERIEPVLRVENMQAALRFYVDTLGFEKAEWSGDEFANVALDGGSIYLSLGDQGRGGAWVWIGVDDVEPLYEHLKARGVPILMPPTNFDWALEMRVADPDGNVLRFGSEPK